MTDPAQQCAAVRTYWSDSRAPPQLGAREPRTPTAAIQGYSATSAVSPLIIFVVLTTLPHARRDSVNPLTRLRYPRDTNHNLPQPQELRWAVEWWPGESPHLHSLDSPHCSSPTPPGPPGGLRQPPWWSTRAGYLGTGRRHSPCRPHCRTATGRGIHRPELRTLSLIKIQNPANSFALPVPGPFTTKQGPAVVGAGVVLVFSIVLARWTKLE